MYLDRAAHSYRCRRFIIQRINTPHQYNASRQSITLATYKLYIEYDGTDWHGWQSQPEDPTVQDAIENALRTALRKPVSITGSGRTDAGVHARGQIAHMTIDQEIDTRRLAGSLNGILPKSVAVRAIECVRDDFHARYDARLRRYAYRICTVPIAIARHYHWHVMPKPDVNVMNQAARDLIGTYDFSAFCRINSKTRNRVCSISRAQWKPGEVSDTWIFDIRADRFLHSMVRSIVGTLVEIGHGKRSPDCIPDLIACKDRREAGFVAPACGLMLEEVYYD